MPSGEPLRGAPPHPRRRRGYTYLGVLALVALTGAGSAALGSAWSTAAQRERERELQFRGGEIARAILRFRQAAEPAAWPPSLEALLADPRPGIAAPHHLRRLYADPFTGRADWVLLAAPADAPEAAAGITGVHSRSDAPRLARGSAQAGAAPVETGPQARVSDWLFTADAVAAAGAAEAAVAAVAAAAAEAASGAARRNDKREER